MVSIESVPQHWPPGHQPLSKSFRDDYKRKRCALAASEVVYEVGIGPLTVEMITARARISRSTFYQVFKNVDSTLKYACELGNLQLREAIEGAAQEPGAWEARMVAGIATLLETAESEPYLATLCLVHGSGLLDPAIGPHDPDLIAAIAALFAEGEAVRSPQFDELLAYGILSIIADRLRRGEFSGLQNLSDPLTDIVRIQLLGHRRPAGAAAARASRRRT